MHKWRLFALSAFASVLATGLGTASSHAQEWPMRQPIRVLVALTPGSAIDLISRLVFEQVSKQIGQTFVIENRSGASQTLAAGAVAKAEADGYTLFFTTVGATSILRSG